MARIISVSSVDDDGAIAAADAARELCRELGGIPDWVLCFFSAELQPAAVLRGLAQKLPESVPLVGCSSYAEIDSNEAMTRSVVLLGARDSGLVAHPVALPVAGRSSFDLGLALGQKLRPLNPSLIVLLPDVLTVNATEVLRGMQAELGASAPIIGGAAADPGTFTKTYQLCGSALQSEGVVAMALVGPLSLVTAARSGYSPVSKPRVATRVEKGNIVLELDGQPALAVYRDFLGPRVSEMPAVSIEFPLGVVPEGSNETQPDLTRAIFGIDEARGALVLGGTVLEGAKLRILSCSQSDILVGARTATSLALSAMPQPDAALLFNCMSRKVVMGGRYRDEVAEALKLLPAGLASAGFYTFGELSPANDMTEHHESTFTLALLKLGHRSAE